jgi:hypothetical protein
LAHLAFRDAESTHDLAQRILICFDLPFGFGEEIAEWLAFVDLHPVGNEFQRANRTGEMII